MAQNTAHVGGAQVTPNGEHGWEEVRIEREWSSGTTKSVAFEGGSIHFYVNGEEVHKEGAAAFFEQWEKPEWITYIGFGGHATREEVEEFAEEHDADGVFVNRIGNPAIYFEERKPPEGFAREVLCWRRAESGHEDYERAME